MPIPNRLYPVDEMDRLLTVHTILITAKQTKSSLIKHCSIVDILSGSGLILHEGTMI